ncbi:MAG: phosphotransacetylase family protein [Spirochaetes bacterium]|nr:phosphotransacetylase family protein [Spirochaetota bacterium]
MKKIVFSSVRGNAGKTSLISGIISSKKDKKIAYAKPLGDRLIYKRKKSWDYDANVIVNLLGRKGELESRYEKITLGFDHAKLRYMYDDAGIKSALDEMIQEIGDGNDVMFFEGGRNLSFGTGLNLDPISLTKMVDGTLVVVVSGNREAVMDEIRFFNKYMHMEGCSFGGVIINKVHDIEDFENVCVPYIREMGVELLGLIPYKEQLTYFTLDFLAEKLFAKVLAGEDNLKNAVQNIIIGALSTTDPHRNPLFTRPSLNKPNQLMITGGDRSDMILAALDRDTAGIILTNDIMPPQNIISKVKECGIPLLLVTMDTFQAAKQIEDLDALLTPDNDEKLNLLSQLIEKYTTIDKIM